MNTKIILEIHRTNTIFKKLEPSSRTFNERLTRLRSTFLTKTTNAKLFAKKITVGASSHVTVVNLKY